MIERNFCFVARVLLLYGFCCTTWFRCVVSCISLSYALSIIMFGVLKRAGTKEDGKSGAAMCFIYLSENVAVLHVICSLCNGNQNNYAG